VHRRPLLCLLLLAACSTTPPPSPAQPGIPVPADAQEAVVVRVVDGDTLVLRGRGVGPLRGGDRTRVRVLLVDTPEVHTDQECFGQEASDRAEQLLPDGATVRVQADRDPEDRFGRALLHVWADGVNVGEALVREGYATVLQLDPNERYLAQFEAAERDAREAGRGLWSACLS
jgi:micrococcal nuclease